MPGSAGKSVKNISLPAILPQLSLTALSRWLPTLPTERLVWDSTVEVWEPGKFPGSLRCDVSERLLRQADDGRRRVRQRKTDGLKQALSWVLRTTESEGIPFFPIFPGQGQYLVAKNGLSSSFSHHIWGWVELKGGVLSKSRSVGRF